MKHTTNRTIKFQTYNVEAWNTPDGWIYNGWWLTNHDIFMPEWPTETDIREALGLDKSYRIDFSIWNNGGNCIEIQYKKTREPVMFVEPAPLSKEEFKQLTRRNEK